MLDPSRYALNAETVGFRKRMRQSVDWASFNEALQTQTDSIKVRRELEETPINELHVMGGQRFGIEGNAKTNELARQQRQMNGYVLRSFLATGGPIILPPKKNDSLLGIPSKFGQIQYTPNAVVGQQYTSSFTEPLNAPLDNNTILLGRAGVQAKSNSISNPYKALQFQMNMDATQDQIQQVEAQHLQRRGENAQEDFRRQSEILSAPKQHRKVLSALHQVEELRKKYAIPPPPPRPSRPPASASASSLTSSLASTPAPSRSSSPVTTLAEKERDLEKLQSLTRLVEQSAIKSELKTRLIQQAQNPLPDSVDETWAENAASFFGEDVERVRAVVLMSSDLTVAFETLRSIAEMERMSFNLLEYLELWSSDYDPENVKFFRSQLEAARDRSVATASADDITATSVVDFQSGVGLSIAKDPPIKAALIGTDLFYIDSGVPQGAPSAGFATPSGPRTSFGGQTTGDISGPTSGVLPFGPDTSVVGSENRLSAVKATSLFPGKKKRSDYENPQALEKGKNVSPWEGPYLAKAKNFRSQRKMTTQPNG